MASLVLYKKGVAPLCATKEIFDFLLVSSGPKTSALPDPPPAAK